MSLTPAARLFPQMRYQQRQQIERDAKKAAAQDNNGRSNSSGGYAATGQSAQLRSLAAIEPNGGNRSLTLGAGKVRQMFDERRHKTAGIDKSYPLQPIAAAATVRRQPAVAAVTTVRKTAAVSTHSSGSRSRVDDGHRIAAGKAQRMNNNSGDYANGNYTLSPTHVTSADFLDNEEFPGELASRAFWHTCPVVVCGSKTMFCLFCVCVLQTKRCLTTTTRAVPMTTTLTIDTRPHPHRLPTITTSTPACR